MGNVSHYSVLPELEKPLLSSVCVKKSIQMSVSLWWRDMMFVHKWVSQVQDQKLVTVLNLTPYMINW